MTDVKAISDDGGGDSQSELDILNDESVPNIEDPENEAPDEEDPVEDENDDKVEKDPTEEDDDEEEEIEVDEEKPRQPLTFKEVTAKYPKFWKEFPEVRRVVAEASQYNALFDAVDDAREAVAKSQTFDLLSDALLTHGNSLPLVENLAKNSTPEAFQKFAESILPAIHKQDAETYIKITVPIVKKILRAAANDGNSSGSTNLTNAAKVLTQYLFGSAKLEVLNEEPKAEVKEDPEKIDLKNRLAANIRTQEVKFMTAVKTRTEGALKSSIVKYIKEADKGNLLNQYTRNAIIKDALGSLDRKLVADTEHMRTMGSLREKAARANFAGDWEPRVSSAYLGRAKNLLNGIQRQLVSEALGTKPQNGKAAPTTSSSIPNNGNGRVSNDPKKVFKGEKRMSDREFLDSD